MQCLIHLAQSGKRGGTQCWKDGGKGHLLRVRALSKAVSFSHHSCTMTLVVWPYFTDEDAVGSEITSGRTKIRIQIFNTNSDTLLALLIHQANGVVSSSRTGPTRSWCAGMWASHGFSSSTCSQTNTGPLRALQGQ